MDYGNVFSDVVGSINDDSGSWYDPVVNLADDFAGWMEANPTMAKMIGGAAVGAVGYINEKDKQKHEEKMYQRRFNDQLSLSQASSGDDGYGSHANNLIGGTGLLINRSKKRG